MRTTFEATTDFINNAILLQYILEYKSLTDGEKKIISEQMTVLNALYAKAQSEPEDKEIKEALKTKTIVVLNSLLRTKKIKPSNVRDLMDYLDKKTNKIYGR
jgi:hypothetical protein